jgi:putative peptidoglycan lipid II flippase
LIQLGALDAAGADLVARVVSAYVLGAVGWSLLQLLTRAHYAAGDTRTPTLVNVGVTVAGAALMLWWFSVSTGGDRVVVLGLAQSVALVGGAGALLFLLARRVGQSLPVVASVARSAACAAVAYGAARAVGASLSSDSRAGAALTVVVGGVAATLVYVGLQWAARAPEFRGVGAEAAV